MPHRHRRSRARALSLGLCAVAACGRERGTGLEAEIRRGLAGQLETEIARVTCTSEPVASCQARVGDQWLAITVAPAQGGGVAWELAGIVVAAAPLERHLAAELDDIGIDATADCGARFHPVQVGARILCSLGEAGAAWATITDDAGGFDVEIALGGDAVRARSEDLDVAGLDELSAALDMDPPSDEAAFGDGDAGSDAGGAPP